MRLCLFTPVFLPDVGGAELAIDALARRFMQAGHEPVVLACGKRADLDLPYPVRFAPKPLAPHWFPERVGRHLRKLHRAFQFDLFFTNYTHPTGYAAVRVAAKTQTPVVIGSQGGDLYHSSKHRKQAHLWRRSVAALTHADALVAISPHMEALMREICPNPPTIACIANGVDLADISAPAPRPSDFNDPRPFALCLGNLGPMKGFDDALAAWAQQRDRLDHLILVIVGDGPLAQSLRQRARELNLGGKVMFMGRRLGADKRWFLQNCVFGVMPSIEEGLPLVALEFMANGKALLCTTNPSFDELVENGVQGYRVPPRDVKRIGEAMVKLDGADLIAMGQSVREKSCDFDWSRIADRYLVFFERVLNQSRSGAGAAR